jgi:hypothetical protein
MMVKTALLIIVIIIVYMLIAFGVYCLFHYLEQKKIKMVAESIHTTIVDIKELEKEYIDSNGVPLPITIYYDSGVPRTLYFAEDGTVKWKVD